MNCWSNVSCISLHIRIHSKAIAFSPFNCLFICCYVTALNWLLHSTEMSFNEGSMLPVVMLCITCSIEIHLQWCDESIKFYVMTIISETRTITQEKTEWQLISCKKKSEVVARTQWLEERTLGRMLDWGRVHSAFVRCSILLAWLTLFEQVWGFIINFPHTLRFDGMIGS